jgi:hypothetical protein
MKRVLDERGGEDRGLEDQDASKFDLNDTQSLKNGGNRKNQDESQLKYEQTTKEISKNNESAEKDPNQPNLNISDIQDA